MTDDQRRKRSRHPDSPSDEALRLVSEIRAGWPLAWIESAAVLGDEASRLAAPTWEELDRYVAARTTGVHYRHRSPTSEQRALLDLIEKFGVIVNELGEGSSDGSDMLIHRFYEDVYERIHEADTDGRDYLMHAELAQDEGDHGEAFSYLRLASGDRGEFERQRLDLIRLLTGRP